MSKRASLYAFCLAVTAVITYAFSFRTVIMFDHSIIIDRSYRMIIGQIPYRDYVFPTPPVCYMIQALVFKIFSPKIFWMEIYLSLMNCGIVLIALRFAEEVIKVDFKTLALLVAPLAIVWSPGIILMRPWYDFDANLFAYSALFLLCLGTLKNHTRCWLAAGICCAMSAFSKQNIGAGATIGGMIFIFLQPVSFSDKIKRMIWFAFGLAIPTLLLALYFVHHHALWNAFDWVFLRAYQKTEGGFIHKALKVIFRTDNNFVKFDFIVYLASLIACWKLRKENLSDGSLKLGIVLFAWITVWLSCLAEGGNDYPQQQIYLNTIFAILFTIWFKPGQEIAFPSLIKKPGFVLTIFAAFIAFVWPIRVNWRIPFKFKEMRWTLNHERLKGLYFNYTDYRVVEGLMEFEKGIPKTEGVFIWPDPQFFYFAAGRTEPTAFSGFAQPGLENPAEAMDQIVKNLVDKDVRWAIVGQETFFDFGSWRFGGIKENWDEAVKKGMAMSARGDYSKVRDYLHKNFIEVPGPLGFWTLKRKT